VNRDALEELSAYIDWAWGRYEVAIRPLGDELLVRAAPGSGWPALRDALAHINWAYDRWIADPTRTSDLPVADIRSWAEVEIHRRRVRAVFNGYLASLSDAELATRREVNIDGELISHAPIDILTLLLMHEREHHGDLNTLLYQLGQEPVQTSYRFFLVETGRRAQRRE
jgi:uncharacterized damage-inducible protein DinB